MENLCVFGGSVWTGRAESYPADTVLTDGHKIKAVGIFEDVRKHPLFPSSRMLELNGESVVPGLSDSHLHLLAYAKQKTASDLTAAKNKQDMLDILREQASKMKPDDWVCGCNFNESNWPGGVMPDWDDLDALEIPNPVLIQRVCTHITVINRKATELCGAGDATGGILAEGAQAAAHSAMSRAMHNNRGRLSESLKNALDECASYGLTCLYTCGADSLGMEEPMSLYQDLYASDNLSARVFAFHDRLPSPEMTTGFGNRWIGYQGHKIFLDGSLGARTAALSEAYFDAPGKKGALLHETKDLAELLARLEACGCQALVHAIGDAALDQLLEALESARGASAPRGLPLLVNHCMVCRPDQIARMRRLGVGATIQPTFVCSDRRMAPPRLGKRIDEGIAYPWRALSDAGIILNGSSDCPIEPLNPWQAIWAAAERKTDALAEPWMPGQCLSVEEALRLYTVNPALSSGTESWRGTVEVGKEADFVILDRNIFTQPAVALRETKAVSTVAGGRVTHGDAAWTR